MEEMLSEKQETEGKVIKASFKKSIFTYQFIVPENDAWEYTKLYLIYRTAKQEQEQVFEIPVQLLRKRKNKLYYRGQIDVTKVHLKPNYWDFRMGFREKGSNEEGVIRLVNRSYLNYLKYCLLFYKNEYVFPDGMFVYPYVDAARNISLQYRMKGEYDDWHFRMKERIALICYILGMPFWKRKNILLVFEQYCMMAQDNGYYFFRYCMENNMEEELGYHIYYVIDKNSKDREAVRKYDGHVLDFMSVKHMVYALASKVYASTDAKGHIYPGRRKGSILFHFVKRAKLVFLQHGVTAMKKVDFFYGKGRGGGADMFIVTSKYEQDIVLKNFGYTEKEVPVTGFARWDVLEDHSENKRDILLMPTWRSWLEDSTDEMFRQSEYYRQYMQLLANGRLYELLEKYDLTLNFYLHTKFKDYIGNFLVQSDRIHYITFGERPLNELIMDCKLLITDYSSVAWDVFYLKKPVVFFQFDLQDYLNIHGSYMDMKKELFGPKVLNVEQLLQVLEQQAKDGFILGREWEKKHQENYAYNDKKNCSRICQKLHSL